MKICDALRQAVLQAAIQGKLTTQRKEDGDARELLKLIAVEKDKLIKDNKIRKDRHLPVISEVEIPFNVPDNWVWGKLENFTILVTDYVANGSFTILKKNTKTFLEKNFAIFVRTIDLSNNFQKELVYIDEFSYNFLEKTKLYGGELIIPNIGGSIGKVFMMPKLNFPMSLAPNSIVVKCFDTISDYYLKYILLSNYGYTELIKNKGGTATPKFSKTELRNLWLPIPPFPEQKRIVAKVEKLMAEIDELEKVENELNALKAAFPGDMKAALFQAAMQGKLTTQRKEDGDARELLKQIAKEKAQLIKEKKIKKDKSLPEITEDEIPFDVPDNWVWVRLNHLVYNSGQMKPDSDFCYIDIGSIDNKKQILSNEENIVSAQDAPSRARKIVKLGDIIYSTVRPYLHNMAIIDREFSLQPIASTGFAVLSCFKGVFNKYLFYYLLSPHFDEYANNTENAKGVAYPAINDEKLYKAVIPLPPLTEQKRIVAKLERLLPLCDGLLEEELEKLLD